VARRKKKLSKVYVVSLGAHVAIGLALAVIPQERLREVVAITMGDAPKPEKKPEPPKPPPRAAEPPAARAPRAAHSTAPQPSAAAPSQAAAFTDLGLTLDSSSADGLAVNTVAPAAPRAIAPKPAALVVKPKLLVARAAPSACLEPLIKATPLSIVRPGYTDDARHAHIQGRVRVEVSVDEQGNVISARVIEGLGHGLDEAALAAVKNLHFAAATQCGHAVAAPFVIAMRFQLGS
jgi:protein TonB